MQMKLLGFMPMDFESQNGERIKGMNIFTAFKQDNVQGLCTSKFFLREDIVLPEGTKINDLLEVSFTNRGKIDSIVKA